MQLVDKDIADRINSGIVRVTPFNKSQINPNSYDLRLGEDFIQYDEDDNDTVIDPYNAESIAHKTTRHNGETFIIEPFHFVLARTIEHIELPAHICAMVGGKSSLARLGLSIHQTGGFVDAGFRGTLTLELFNANCRPIKLYAGMPIAQLMFIETLPCCRPYNVREKSKYNGQIHPEMSQFFKNDKPYQRHPNV